MWNPAIMRRSVVLPQPEGPRRKKSLPGAMARETLSTAGMVEAPVLSARRVMYPVGLGKGLDGNGEGDGGRVGWIPLCNGRAKNLAHA